MDWSGVKYTPRCFAASTMVIGWEESWIGWSLLEEVKQQIHATSAGIKRSDERSRQFRQNGTFERDQRQIYCELLGDGTTTAKPSDGTSLDSQNAVAF